MSHDPLDLGSPDLAFEGLIRAHYPRLFGLAFSYLRDPEEAEDAVQGALLKVWRARSVLDPIDPESYLFRAVRNQCVSVLRRRRRWREDDLADVPSSIAVSPIGLAALEERELHDRIQGLIAELPDRCRLVFLLSREQGLSYGEIGRSLGISPKTVEVQMGKALRFLRSRLARFLSFLLVSTASLINR